MTDDVTYLKVLEKARNEYASGDSFLTEVFDRAIRQVKAEAWDEGFKHGTENRDDVRANEDNPYL